MPSNLALLRKITRNGDQGQQVLLNIYYQILKARKIVVYKFKLIGLPQFEVFSSFSNFFIAELVVLDIVTGEILVDFFLNCFLISVKVIITYKLTYVYIFMYLPYNFMSFESFPTVFFAEHVYFPKY